MKIYYPVEGEILKVQEKAKLGESYVIRYLCRVKLEDGGEILVPNVEASTGLGGISDYFLFRHRGSLEDPDISAIPTEQKERDATTGDRCIIVFINGSLLKARIIGWNQHPNQTPEIIDAKTKKPQAVAQVLGIRMEISDTGAFRLIHKGAPELKYDPQNSITLDSNVLGIKQEISAKSGGNSIGGDNNGQITPKEKDEITLIDMLDGGGFQVKDAQGQGIILDREAGSFLLTNSSSPSWLSKEAPNYSTFTGKTGEYVEFLKDSGQLTIGSSKSTFLDAKGDFKNIVAGSYSAEITKDYSTKISGNEKRDVTGQVKMTATGGYSIESSKAIEGKAKTSITFKDSAGATLKIANGKVALGSTSAELVDILSQLLQQLSIEVYPGFGAPAAGAAIYLQLKTLLDTIKGGV